MIVEVGIPPYSERLVILKQHLLSDDWGGDLIEVYKAKQGLSNINGLFRFSTSGLNKLSKPSKNNNTNVCKLTRNFINERVKSYSYWDKLPVEVKNAQSLNEFKGGYRLSKVYY